MEEVLRDHPGMHPDYPPRVYFNNFNDSSLNLFAIYWYHPASYWDYMEFTDQVNTAIFDRFNKAGIEFAYPYPNGTPFRTDNPAHRRWHASSRNRLMVNSSSLFFIMRFHKYHALGNDYLVLDPAEAKQLPSKKEIIRICHRNFGPAPTASSTGHCPQKKPHSGYAFSIPTAPKRKKSGNGSAHLRTLSLRQKPRHRSALHRRYPRRHRHLLHRTRGRIHNR